MATQKMAKENTVAWLQWRSAIRVGRILDMEEQAIVFRS